VPRLSKAEPEFDLIRYRNLSPEFNSGPPSGTFFFCSSHGNSMSMISGGWCHGPWANSARSHDEWQSATRCPRDAGVQRVRGTPAYIIQYGAVAVFFAPDR